MKENILIEVKSYIKKDKRINSLENIENEWSKYFTAFDHVSCLENISDFNYLEGAIIIKYYGKNLMGFRYWDLIVELWIYFLNAIGQLMEGRDKVSFYFPDQPLEVKMRFISQEFILFCIGNEQINLLKYEFIAALLKGAEQFFEILKNSTDNYLAEQSNIQLTKIDKLDKCY